MLFKDGTDYADISLGILTQAPIRMQRGCGPDFFLFPTRGQRAFVEKSLQYGARKGLPSPAGFPSLDGLVMVTQNRDERERNAELVKLYEDTLFR